MAYITDAMMEYTRRRYAIEDSKEDIQKFIDKFGQEMFDLFVNSKDRLKNANISTDMTWHIKNTEPEKMKEMLYALRSKTTGSETGTIPGKYIKIGNIAGYDVYRPLNVEASMALGVGTGWCICGRYGHAGEMNFKPSYENAKQHWDSYAAKDIKFFFYLKNGIAKYAVCVYPNTQTFKVQFDEDEEKFLTSYEKEIDEYKDYVTISTNVEIYDQYDNMSMSFTDTDIDIKLMSELGVDELPGVKITYKKKADLANEKYTIEDGMILSKDKSVLFKVKNHGYSFKHVVPEYVKKITSSAFKDTQIVEVEVKNQNIELDIGAFEESKIKRLILPTTLTYLPVDCCYNCEQLEYVNILDQLKDVGKGCFCSCKKLKFSKLPEWPNVFDKISDCEVQVDEIETSSFDISVEGPKKVISTSTDDVILHSKTVESFQTTAKDIKIQNCHQLAKISMPNVTSFSLKGYTKLTELRFNKPLKDFEIAYTDAKLNVYLNDVTHYFGEYIIQSDSIATDHAVFEAAQDIVIHTANKKLLKICKEHNVKYVDESIAHDSIKTFIVKIK